MLLIYSLLAVVIQLGGGARILVIVSTPSYSHQVVFQPLWRELSLRGHQVTTITTDPINNPKLTNLTEIDMSFSYKTWNKHIMESVLSNRQNAFRSLFKILDQLFDVYEEQLQHPSIQALINGNHEFDLIILNPVSPPMAAFVEKYKCPLITMMTIDAPSMLLQVMGNPTHPSIYPNVFSAYDEVLSFPQRISSFISEYIVMLVQRYSYIVANELTRKYFGPHYSTLEQIMDNTSMLFVNSDPIFHRVRPLVPSVIQIGGGSHLKPLKPLPTELKKLLDDAKDGFVYFSLGSNIKSKDIPEELRMKILETFAELPYTVLWKFEAENLPNKPNNVFISKWLPQQDVLRHPNIKLFITQGGLQSTDEAIYSGVPLIAIPFFADQSYNARKIVNKGLGLSMEYTTFEKREFKEKILEVIENPIYRNQIKKLAELAQDQPMTGLERAVWWTEYVIRHKGAAHLKSPLKDIPWYQYLLLDVIGVLAVTMVISYLIVRYLWRLFRRKPKDQEKKMK
ncbi:hypothetical protein RI129_010803 [Pyrocoelia pectoralis]|uniref:UDP-glucuronosyltransferase n=1 Tax=Pyrocoelia pectoralis TaxID=417401 RepID=A0AAN7ZDY8_9COLE